jgi:N-dimethylarginine dimethylaminohydrolase
MLPTQRFLMCSPDYFDVTYVINPWMEGNVHATSVEKARQQWQRLYEIITRCAEVELIPPQPGLPDMSFTANAGLILKDKVILSRFRFPERQREEPHFEEWFNSKQYRVIKVPDGLSFEGAGDALIDFERGLLWTGCGHRTPAETHAYLAQLLDLKVLTLGLVTEHFYHLDTCFCPLDNGYLLYHPEAFDEAGQRLIAEYVPAEKRLLVSAEDAYNFACNAINIDNLVILSRASNNLRTLLSDTGFEVVQTDLSEFTKAGGAAKCLTLRLQ